MADFNAAIIDEFRANGGTVATAGFGRRLVLVHHRGVKSGAAYIAPLMALRDGDGWLIAASAAGSPTHPKWLGNLVAHPETSIEVPADQGTESVAVRAEVLGGAARDAAWARFLAAAPAFAGYEAKAGARQIPVVRLVRR